MSKKTVRFYEIMIGIGNLFDIKGNPLELMRLINKEEFLEIRGKLSEIFDIKPKNEFDQEIDEDNELELGDISDAVLITTKSLYPPRPTRDRVVELDEREVWFHQIIEAIDSVAVSEYYKVQQQK
jgi:hypothetical protein